MGLAGEVSDQQIAEILGPQIPKAFRYAHEKLHGFVRKTTGEPAFCHSADIALRARDLGYSSRIIQGSLLHDTVEDRSKTLEDVLGYLDELALYFDNEVVWDVRCSTNLYSIIIRQLERRLPSHLPFDSSSANLMRQELISYRQTLSPEIRQAFQAQFSNLIDYFLVHIDLSAGERKARIDKKFTVVSELRLQSYKLFVQDIHEDSRFRGGRQHPGFHEESLVIKALDLVDNLRTSEVANFGSLERILLKVETFLDSTFFLHDYIRQLPVQTTSRLLPNRHSTFILLYDYLKCHLIEQLLERSRALVFLSDTRFGFLAEYLLREVERLRTKYKIESPPVDILGNLREQIRASNLQHG